MSAKMLKVFADITATSCALASLIMMGFVFWNEVHGRGVLYIEPNRTIAFTELLMTGFGFGGTLGLWIRRLIK